MTLPFLSTPRMFGTLTVAPQWLVHPAGVNQTNHAQLFLLGYLEYRANPSTTFFLQPSRLVQYNPVDPYPEYTPSLIYGLSHHFTKQTFVQMTVLEGGATNYNQQWGIVSLTVNGSVRRRTRSRRSSRACMRPRFRSNSVSVRRR